MVGPLRWVLLLAVGLALANERQDKDMEPVIWEGGETLYPDTGEKHFNGLATRAQIHGNFAFLAIPKLKPGVISTCCKLDMRREVGSSAKPVITPFPPDAVHDPNSCEGLHSVVDLFLDHMNILWTLDVGRIIPPKDAKSRPLVCPPKVVGYNIDTGKVVYQASLHNQVGPSSRVQFVITDYDQAGRPFVYITDAGTKAIIVWDVAEKNVYRVGLPDAVLDERAPKDVLYAVLIRKTSGDNKLYFTYKSSDSLWSVDVEHLQRGKSMAKAVEVGKKPYQLICLGTDDWSAMYIRSVDKMEVYKWDTDLEFTEKNFQLVHTGEAEMTPTHAIPDYENGVMRTLVSNLKPYLKTNCTPEASYNSLTVMSVSDDQLAPETAGDRSYQ